MPLAPRAISWPGQRAAPLHLLSVVRRGWVGGWVPQDASPGAGVDRPAELHGLALQYHALTSPPPGGKERVGAERGEARPLGRIEDLPEVNLPFPSPPRRP